MKVGKLLLALALTIALVATFIPFVSASGDIAIFELGAPNRENDNSFQDVDNSNYHEGLGEAGSSWNGLTFEIFAASKTLFIEVENEPGNDDGEIEIVIFGNHDGDYNWAWGAGAFKYAVADVYEDGIITIDLTESEAFKIFIDGGKHGFRIVLNDGFADVGDIFAWLEYVPSEMEKLTLWMPNRIFNPREYVYADQDNAAWEKVEMIGLNTDVMALAKALVIEVENEPELDTLAVTIFGNHNSWSFSEFITEYNIADLFVPSDRSDIDGFIVIPLAGGNEPGYMKNLRDDVASTGFCFVIIYGDEDAGIGCEDLGIGLAWLALVDSEIPIADAPPPVEPDPPAPPPVEPDPPAPVDPPAGNTEDPKTDDEEGGFPWLIVGIIAGAVVVVVIIVVVVSKGKK